MGFVAWRSLDILNVETWMCMRDKMFIALLAFLLCVSAKGQSLEQAFTEISCMEGFQMSDCSAEEYGYPKEIGRMRMTMRGNSDSRDEVLAVLSKIPQGLLAAEFADERGKTDRWYIEDLDGGGTVMMHVFVGRGGNDIVAQMFSGSPGEYYHRLAEKIAGDI